MTKIVGLTGGIGSGKSTVGKMLVAYGIPLYDSDLRARNLMNESSVIISNLKSWYGESIYQEGLLDRKKLGTRVFKNPEELTRLNQLTHPLVREDFTQWVHEQNTKFVIKEAAILFESGAYKQCNYIVTVSAEEQIRMNRVISRDNTTDMLVKDRMNKQWTDAQREAKSDYIIHNNTTLDELKTQVDVLYQHLNDIFKEN
ncbi:MAG: dephospho-CoA kinase [Weeksellaceae bacterium]